MRATLAGLVHEVFRRAPATRNVYAERAALRAAIGAHDRAAAAARAEADALRARLEEAGRIAADRQRALDEWAAFTRAVRHERALMASGWASLAGHLVRIEADGPLGPAGGRLLFPLDDVMYPITLRDRGWQMEELAFIARCVDPARRYVLIDIGANVGLFARQVALRLANVERVLCVEADPDNFRCLRFNMAELEGREIALHNVALADADGELAWYRDAENMGNYSLNADAMRARPHARTVVRAAEAGAFLARHAVVPEGMRLIWKSDTQGCDEQIVARAPMALWRCIDVAIVELWRIAKAPFDADAFYARIADFPHRAIGARTGASVEDVRDYLSGTDYAHEDLYLWRDG